MSITYDILVDDENGHPKDCLTGSIESKYRALLALMAYRAKYPTAYLVKCVQTRCRELGVDIVRRKRMCRP